MQPRNPQRGFKKREELPKGVKKRQLEKVANYEYSLPKKYDNEEIDEELGGRDVWDEPDGEYDSDISGVSEGEDVVTLSEFWDLDEQESDSDTSDASDKKQGIAEGDIGDDKESDIEDYLDDEFDEKQHSELVDKIKSLSKYQK